MNTNTFSERIKSLRSSLNKTQKEFANFLGIPQSTLSSYENGKINPTIDVVSEIADKCNVSIDWLCGRDVTSKLTDLSALANFFYELYETKEIKCETIIHDHIENGLDIEKENETDDRFRWWVQLKFYGNDHSSPNNSSICNIIKKIYEQNSDLENYSISKEYYDSEKKQLLDYYTENSLPLFKKDYPKLTREDRIKKHIEYLKKTNKL